MKIKHLKVERWVADVTYKNRLTKESEVQKNLPREKWTWYLVDDDGKRLFCCETSADGDGLWINSEQTIGTCDFTLYGYTLSGARNKIARTFDLK